MKNVLIATALLLFTSISFAAPRLGSACGLVDEVDSYGSNFQDIGDVINLDVNTGDVTIKGSPAYLTELQKNQVIVGMNELRSMVNLPTREFKTAREAVLSLRDDLVGKDQQLTATLELATVGLADTRYNTLRLTYGDLRSVILTEDTVNVLAYQLGNFLVCAQ